MQMTPDTQENSQKNTIREQINEHIKNLPTGIRPSEPTDIYQHFPQVELNPTLPPPLKTKKDYPEVQDKWKQPAVPRHVVQMFIVDQFGKLLLMHRSNNVHSARNVWSIPTGTHEIGESVATTIQRELMEEYGLHAQQHRLISQYENIAGDLDHPDDPQYHWVLSLFAVRVTDVTMAINREPEKHDKMEFVPLSILEDDVAFLEKYQFHKSLHYHLPHWPKIYYNRIEYFLSVS